MSAVVLQTIVSGTTEIDDKLFVFGNYIDEVLVMSDLNSTNTVPDGDYYYGHDHLYSVCALFDSSGSVVERYYYDAYGKVRIWDGDYLIARNISQFGNPYSFTGRELDVLDGGSLKIMYYRARYYDTETGRFIQRDPLGIDPAGGSNNPFSAIIQYEDNTNLYGYVQQRPVNYNDFSGTSSCDCTKRQLSKRPMTNTKHKINYDQMQYSCNCGWLDWTHGGGIPGKASEPTGGCMAKLKNAYLNNEPFSDKGCGLTNMFFKKTSYKIKYCIFQSGGIFGSGTCTEGHLSKGLSEGELESALLTFFMLANNAFEEHQGGGIVGLISGDSCFSEDDLTSDLINFYRQLGKITGQEAQDQCKAIGKAESMALFDCCGLGTNKNWCCPVSHQTETCKEQPKFPAIFTTIQPIPGLIENYVKTP